MTEAIIIILAWYLNAFSDAIRFGKQTKCHELFHIIKWLSYWVPFMYIVYRLDVSVIWIAVIVILSFGWNILYRMLRHIDIAEWDDKYRIKWLGKIFDRGGII